MATYNNHYCVIMAGGGNRFWPITREAAPKPFMEIASTGKSFIQTIFDRFAEVIPCDHILVVTSERFRPLAEAHLPKLRPENLLIEPYSRGTAPCIAYASAILRHRDPSAVMLVSPADHIIRDEAPFLETVRQVLDYASKHPVLMTIGIVPDHPDTHYGYIQKVGGKDNTSIPVKVKTFTEKPTEDLAAVFCKSGEFYWNTGIYAWQASVIQEEMTTWLPDVARLFGGWDDVAGTSRQQAFIDRAYTDCENISIDYGVMEKTSRAMLYPAKFGWIDFDDWSTLYKGTPLKDNNGNHIVLPHDNVDNDLDMLVNNKGSIIIEKNKGKLLVIKGLKDFIVIDTDDVLLICPRVENPLKELMPKLAMPRYDKFR